MHAKRTILAILLLSASATAQDFTVFPDPGKLAGYVAVKEPGKWIVFGPGGFTPVQPTVIDGGKAIVWQGAAGDYAVIFIPPGDAQPLTQLVQLGSQPKPPTPPTPPTPPLPEFAKQVRDWAATTVPKDAQVKCRDVAQSLRTIAAQMAAGTLTDPAKIIEATAAANQAAVGDQKDAWLPFFEQLRQHLNAEADAGRLKTVEQHQRLWEHIAQGLEAVQ